METEIRDLGTIEIRKCDKEDRMIEGYSVVFNSLSHDLGGFREQILPEAIEGVLERSDIQLLLNHDNKRGILARSKRGAGSLTLEVDDKGLRFSTEAPRTALGDEVLEYIRRGDATQCSFAFTVAEGGDHWERQADGKYIRTITAFDRLYDCSILTCEPAYEATSVKCARYEEILEEERIANEQRMKEEEEKRLAAEQEQREAEEKEKTEKLAAYYEQLRKEYQDIITKQND